MSKIETINLLPDTEPDSGDYTGEDGLLYCGKCRKPKEAYFPEGKTLFGLDRHPAECDCQRAQRMEREAAEQQRRHLDTVEDLKRRGFSDTAIHFVHSVNVDFINAAGLFREDRDNEIIAAILNITLSILGAKTIGLAGVLLGTVVSQMWFWFGRSYVVFKLCLQADKEDYLKYWLKNIVDGIALTVSIVFCAYLNSRLPIANGYLKFVCSGILCEAVSVALFGVFHFGDPEVRKMLKYLVNHIRKR